jgi:hypothetical protein
MHPWAFMLLPRVFLKWSLALFGRDVFLQWGLSTPAVKETWYGRVWIKHMHIGLAPLTAAQISRIGDMQYLRIYWRALFGGALWAIFENASFGQLRTSLHEDIWEFNNATRVPWK